jgi:hypothetical protein
MSSLPDRSDSPRSEPQPSGIIWGEVIALAVTVATVVASGALLLWGMGVI